MTFTTHLYIQPIFKATGTKKYHGILILKIIDKDMHRSKHSYIVIVAQRWQADGQRKDLSGTVVAKGCSAVYVVPTKCLRIPMVSDMQTSF